MSFFLSDATTTACVTDETSEYVFTVYSAPLSPELAATAVQFLREHFGDPPRTPRFCLPAHEILSGDDLFLVAHRGSMWAGCIRYRWIGWYASEKRYAVDAFCVRRDDRGNGVGRALLYHLRAVANRRGTPCAFFLKEGSPLPWWVRPFFTGSYVYRATAAALAPALAPVAPIAAITPLPTLLAHRLLAVYASVHPRVFLLFPAHTRNQQWLRYQSDGMQLLVCVQDTFQRMSDHEGGRMGWVTAWLESAWMTDEVRRDAAEQILSSVATQYDFLWLNRAWIGSLSTERWNADGPFQWYTFQWPRVPDAPGHVCGHSYCLLH